MTLPEFIGWIRQEHQCCVDTSARENRCSLRLANLSGDSLVIINGSKYQSNHRFRDKLADRIIFSESHGGFVCVADLKSGAWKARDTIEQVQNGFGLADSMLNGISVQSWFPLVLSDTGPRRAEERIVQIDMIGFQGDRRRLRHSRWRH